MTMPGETEAGSAGKQPCRGIARWAHRDDEAGVWARCPAPLPSHIGSKDPHTLKIPAPRAEESLTKTGLTPFPAEPGHRGLASTGSLSIRVRGASLSSAANATTSMVSPTNTKSTAGRFLILATPFTRSNTRLDRPATAQSRFRGSVYTPASDIFHTADVCS